MESTATPEVYTVFIRGQQFTLSRSQIEYDAPNYFTGAFLGTFSEASSRTIHLWDRNPDLFALIVEYLSGYDILPLAPSAVPKTMSVELATCNLAKDADYFGLSGLSEWLSVPKPQLDILPVEYFPFSDLSTCTIEFDDLLNASLPDGMRWNEKARLVGKDGRAVVVHASNLGVAIAKSMAQSLGAGTRAVGFPPARPELGWKLTDADLRNAPRFLNVGGIIPADVLVSLDGAKPIRGTEMAQSESSFGTYGRMGRLWVDDAWFTLSVSDRKVPEGQVWDGELLYLRARQRATVFHSSFAGMI